MLQEEMKIMNHFYSVVYSPLWVDREITLEITATCNEENGDVPQNSKVISCHMVQCFSGKRKEKHNPLPWMKSTKL